jgi:lysophospholipase L1-like esterase
MAARRRSRSLLAAAMVAGVLAAPVAAAAPGPVTLVAIGDSTGVGVGARPGAGYVQRTFARLTADGRGGRLFNLSRSGATTAQALRDQVPQLASIGREATLVAIGIGANDVRAGVALAEFARRFESIIGGVRARTRAPIIVSNVPDISLAPVVPPRSRPGVARRVAAFNRAIDAVARRHDLRVFDLCRLSQELVPGHPEYFSGDGFHPSDKGYEIWAEHLWPIVQGAL